MNIKIQLEYWEVASLEMRLGDSKRKLPKEKEDENSKSFSLTFSANEVEEFTDKFVIGFDVTLEDVAFALDLHMDFFFKADQELNEEFKTSSFVKISAPAIAFPYVRSYISNLTLQSGYPTIILPSINFVRLAEEKEREESGDPEE